MKISKSGSLYLATALFLIFGLVGLIKAATAVSLGTADGFAILAGSTVTNTGASVVNGDLGLSPGTSVTGFPPGLVNGTQHITDSSASQAQTDLITAYDNAAGQTPTTTIPTELGGSTLTAGVYTAASGTFGLTGTLTLNAQGNPSAVFVFKTASTLITADSSQVVLTNGAQPCNIFWQVGSSATIGTNSTFKGNILAMTSATLTTGANVEGRILARTGAVTLDTNVVTKAACAAIPIPPPATPLAVDSTPPLIEILKVPTPLSLPAGAGSVTYDYTVTNTGIVPMNNINVSDNLCSAVSYVSGDSNGDSNLDVEETWKYSCTTTLTQTTTNTVTATGEANGYTATDTANATVVVGVAVVPPLIHIVKKPSVFTLAFAGPVTYTYTVTNPGTEPINNVSVVDNKCTGLPGRVTGHPGDLNKNNLLESNEAWTFTCKTQLTKTTTNIGTVEGHANGLTAIDFSVATVVVTNPKLPAAGIVSDDQNIPWNIIVPVGFLVAAMLGGYVARKKFTR